MKRYSLVCTLLMIAFRSFTQHVTDDTVFYTPIPKPSLTSKKSKSLFNAADTTETKFYFFSIQSGFLFGCNGCDGDKAPSSSFSAVNGVKIGTKGRIGIGVGYDSYWRFQVLPVFAFVSWDLFGNRNTNAFFIQMNYGESLAWYQKSFQGYGYDETDGGRMISPQLGYRLRYHDINIALLAGVKMQRTFIHYQYPTWSWVSGIYQEGSNSYVVKQDMSRVAITLAVGWR